LLIAAGEFPKPIKLSSSGTAVAWLAHEVAAWQMRRITASRQPTDGGGQ
jgi:predicted DNA-binding transcriptional regulator AlpA